MHSRITHADTDAKRGRGTSACICHRRFFAHLGEVSYDVARPYEQRHSSYESKLQNPEIIANPQHWGMGREEDGVPRRGNQIK